MSSFLSKGLMLPKKCDLQRTPLAKSFSMLATMSFIHLWLNSPLEKSGHSEPWLVKNPFDSQSYCFIPPTILDRCTSSTWSKPALSCVHLHQDELTGDVKLPPPPPELFGGGRFRQGQPPVGKNSEFPDLAENCCPPACLRKNRCPCILKATYLQIPY